MRRLLIALVVGCVVGLAAAAIRADAGDLSIARCAAAQLLRGADPYVCPREAFGRRWPSNPLTTALVLLPLAPFVPRVAAGLFFGLSSGLLAYGATRDGSYWRLLVFASAPYAAALMVVQWSPLLLAAVWLPTLAWLAPVKPQLGIPLIIRHPTALLPAALFVTASLIVLPDWPWRWIAQTGDYDGYLIAALWCPPLLLLALRWRDADARLLLAFCCLPSRLWYDPLLCAGCIRRPGVLCAWVAVSWPCYIGSARWPSVLWALPLFILPALVLALATKRDS